MIGGELGTGMGYRGGNRIIGGERGRFRRCCGKKRSVWWIVSVVLAVTIVVAIIVFATLAEGPKADFSVESALEGVNLAPWEALAHG